MSKNPVSNLYQKSDSNLIQSQNFSKFLHKSIQSPKLKKFPQPTERNQNFQNPEINFFESQKAKSKEKY